MYALLYYDNIKLYMCQFLLIRQICGLSENMFCIQATRVGAKLIVYTKFYRHTKNFIDLNSKGQKMNV